jgi:hypothetical protein
MARRATSASADRVGEEIGRPCSLSKAYKVMRMGKMQDTLALTRLEAVINSRVSPELIQKAAFLPLANATPALLEAGVLESRSAGGGHG